MTPLLESVKQGLPAACFVSRCKRDGCSLLLTGSPSPRLVVNMDSPSLGITQKTRCDYLLLSHTTTEFSVVPIEFKQGSLSATHALDQLEEGANYANQRLPHLQTYRFAPILAHQGLPKAQRDILRKRRLKFRKRAALAKLVRCGSALADHLPRDKTTA